jgi:hypothetical protein
VQFLSSSSLIVLCVYIITFGFPTESHSLECAFSIGHGDDLSSSDSLTNNPPETVMTVCQKHEDACFTTFHAYFDVKENRPLSKIKSQGELIIGNFDPSSLSILFPITYLSYFRYYYFFRYVQKHF